MNCQMHPRRGITLLFVISLIVLFLLMGATFVAISGNFKRVSEARTNWEVRGDSAPTILNRALMDIVRGSTNATSPLRDNNILGDMYAVGFKGSVATAIAEPNADGQLIRLTLNVTTPPIDPTLLDKVGAFGGQVLTFTSNAPAATVKGLSCRIFHYDVQYDATGTPTSRSFLIVPEWSNGMNPFANPMNLVGANVLVNGRAFADTAAVGAISEPYDALDPLNAFLAGPDFDSIPSIYSSFYHFGNATYEAFRPTPFQTTPLADGDGDGRPDLEVDNDGDGIKDSIWIDLGYPVQTDSSGRQYKALAAYMVMDLDPRFNLNLHGGGDDANGRIVPNLPLLGAPAIVPQGQGYGPSEIALGWLFPPPGGFPATPVNFNQEYYNILGDPASQFYGRLGPPSPGGIYGPGVAGVQDAWSQFKLFGYPTSGIGNLFGSRMDVYGRYGWGFPNVVTTTAAGDLPYGMPRVDATPFVDDIVDNPFETDMAWYPTEGPSENSLVAGGSTRADHLFSYKELERVYRMFDLDSKFLANRLLTLAPTTLGNPANRLRSTTAAFEVPVPPSNSAVELANLIQAAATAAGVPPTALSQLDTLLAPDILQGLKMDINRPFGNGVDDNGNGSIDDYTADGFGEINEQVPYPTGFVDIDISRNGQATADVPVLAREQFAKELYVLALLRLQGAGDFNSDGIQIGADSIDRRILAQWAINVVDFRDPDAIMTPFECDDNPFNGWITDGNLLTDETLDGVDNDGNGLIDGADPNEQSTERLIVWGCERPELLIGETLAAHDRRTEDTAEGGTFAGGDVEDFDSRLVPVASAFVELYAPWASGNDSTYPSEIYTGSQINLGQTTPTNLDPVWRIQFVRDGDPGNAHYDMFSTLDAHDLDPDGGAVPSYRNLYFVQPPVGYGADIDIALQPAESFYPTAGFNTLLSVGQHAVVGSAGNLPVAAGQYVSTFGRRLTATEGNLLSFDFPNTRSITLEPATGQVRTIDFDSGTGLMATRTKANVVAIPVAQPRPFNLSDPPGGYLVDPADPTPLTPSLPLLNFLPVEDGLCFADLAGVPMTRDVPIDYDRRQSDVEFIALKDNHTEPSFRVMYLQRLANPRVDWHPVLNPYRTVDSASINLTTYNGVTLDDDNTPTGPSDVPADMNRDFAGMERGRSEKYPTPRDTPPATLDDRRLLWPQERRLIRNSQTGPPAVNIDDIGPPAAPYLAQDLSILGRPDQHYFSSTLYESLGTFNEAYFDVGLDASKPFTWLTWNNRPYVSQYELMLVPTKASSQLLGSFSAKAATDPFGDLASTDPASNGFRHLPNFFLQEVTGAGITVKMELFKLLDFVEVPSRYVGTERYFNANPANTLPVFGLAPPFNNISRFRAPGKPNINTILDRDFWAAVIGEYATDVPFGGPFLDYSIMNNSRRNLLSGEFTRPFREYSAAPVTLGDNEGLLRRGAGTDSLFIYDPISGQQAHNNADRNAYFRFDAIQRLGNVTTTRSSVFAVWITVGYFEVDPATGLLLGTTPQACELGSDTGQVKRHRGFFIFDRSIPVAYEPGVDHNVERAIMVESYIE